MTAVTVNNRVYSDDADPETGLANGGHRARLVPLFSDTLIEIGARVASAAAAFRAIVHSALTIGPGSLGCWIEPNKGFRAGDQVLIRSRGAPSAAMLATVDDYAPDSGLLYFTVAPGDFSGSGSYADLSITGPVGPRGLRGLTGLAYGWDAATALAGPGPGFIRGDNASLINSTLLSIHPVDAQGAPLTEQIAAWGASTSAVKGRLTIRAQSDAAQQAFFDVASVTLFNGYFKLAVIWRGGVATFQAGAPLMLDFSRNGDKGADGINLVNPMTAAGDLLIGGAAGAPARLAKGVDGQPLVLSNGRPAWGYGSSYSPPIWRTGNVVLAASDRGGLIRVTGASTFIQTVAAAATLGNGWRLRYENAGTGVVTIDPAGSETIDGRSSINVYPGEAFEIISTGTELVTSGRKGRGELVLINQTNLSEAQAWGPMEFTLGWSDPEFNGMLFVATRIVCSSLFGALMAKPSAAGSVVTMPGYDYSALYKGTSPEPSGTLVTGANEIMLNYAYNYLLGNPNGSGSVSGEIWVRSYRANQAKNITAHMTHVNDVGVFTWMASARWKLSSSWGATTAEALPVEGLVLWGYPDQNFGPGEIQQFGRRI